MSVFSTLSSLSEESPVEGPSEPITLEMITKAISKIASGKAAGPSGIDHKGQYSVHLGILFGLAWKTQTYMR